MSWNFHQYYSNRTDGLMGQLLLPERQSEALKSLRQKVRIRTREIFEEAKNLVKQTDKNITLDSLNHEVSLSSFKHLSKLDQQRFAVLLAGLDVNVKSEFLKLSPRFWTQGSFTYDTLNTPYKTPPQEMDIDDGTYLPMVFFDNKPVIGHRLLTMLVDTSLKSLVAENPGWKFEAKRTCGRIKVPHLHTHIDVPMYAIPEKQFLEKEVAFKMMAANSRLTLDSIDTVDEKKYELDSECVNLAIRDEDEKWMKSDPKVVDDWFRECCSRIGSHLRKVCRFLKAWRDAQWENGGGPSSISLMAATVTILDSTYHNPTNFGETMMVVAENLSATFRAGVESPDESDERPLFPCWYEHTERESLIIQKMDEFKETLKKAYSASNKQEALFILNSMYGDRVQDSSLIILEQSAPAFAIEPAIATEPFKISSTMKSGINSTMKSG